MNTNDPSNTTTPARTTEISQRQAVTGLRILYPIWAIIGLFSVGYVPAALVVADDAAATAHNIVANEQLFRLGIIGSLTTQVLMIVVVLLLYRLLKSVSKQSAVLMVAFALVGVPIAMLNTLNRIAAVRLLTDARHLAVVGQEQLHDQVMFFLDLNEQGVLIATIFWGLWLIPLGYLVYKSGYFPRILGALLVISGIGYLLDTLTQFALTTYESYEAILEPALTFLAVGELVFMAWVLLKGANIPDPES